jgi:sensor histidine kinase YesM
MENGFKIKTWIRWSYGFFLGIIFKFILDVIFGLIYTNYNLFEPLINYALSIVLFYLITEILIRVNRKFDKKYSWDQKPYQRFIIQFGLDSFVALLIVFVVRWSTNLVFGISNYISLWDELTLAALTLFVVLVFVIIELSIFLLNKWRFSLAELEKFKKENAEYRFELLRSQLNPHFLFNSLNTLSSLVYENQESAGLFIRELSDVYRYILENRDKDLISLETELSFVSSYITLMKLRFGNNLEVKIELENLKANSTIAPLTLQLLIENAIKHNVVSMKKPLRIELFLDEDYIVVSNNIQPKVNKEYSSEMGLKNISNRYSYLSERKIEIIKTNEEFTVKIPLLWNETIKNERS